MAEKLNDSYRDMCRNPESKLMLSPVEVRKIAAFIEKIVLEVLKEQGMGETNRYIFCCVLK